MRSLADATWLCRLPCRRSAPHGRPPAARPSLCRPSVRRHSGRLALSPQVPFTAVAARSVVSWAQTLVCNVVACRQALPLRCILQLCISALHALFRWRPLQKFLLWPLKNLAETAWRDAGSRVRPAHAGHPWTSCVQHIRTADRGAVRPQPAAQCVRHHRGTPLAAVPAAVAGAASAAAAASAGPIVGQRWPLQLRRCVEARN